MACVCALRHPGSHHSDGDARWEDSLLPATRRATRSLCDVRCSLIRLCPMEATLCKYRGCGSLALPRGLIERIRSHSSGKIWELPWHPETGIVEGIDGLQWREITPEDYELLMQLDDDGQSHGLSVLDIGTALRPLREVSDPCVCAICMEDCVEESSELRCGHVLHRACAYEWLARNVCCPVCRSDQSIGEWSIASHIDSESSFEEEYGLLTESSEQGLLVNRARNHPFREVLRY